MKIWILLVILFSTSTSASDWYIDNRVSPTYPVKALQTKLEGCVTLQFFIDEHGLTQFVEPIASTNKIFEGDAFIAVSQWKYKTDKLEPEAQRLTVILEFKLEDNEEVSYNLDDCKAQLTDESHNMEVFRQNRLLTPVFAPTYEKWKQKFFSYYGVLDDNESIALAKATTKLRTHFDGTKSDKESAFLSLINGLNYFGIMQQAQMVNEEIVEKYKEEAHQPELVELPITPIYLVARYWNSQGMLINLEQSVYESIEVKKLAVEFTISKRGKVTVIGFCRSIEASLQQELTTQINNWRLTQKSLITPNIRTIMLLPAPKNLASYIDCDSTWHVEEVEQLEEMERNAIYR